MPTRALGALLAAVAAVAFVLSIVSAAWWDGHPRVDGRVFTAKDVHIGLYGAQGCNTGGTGECQPLQLGAMFTTIAYGELGGLALTTAFAILIAGAAWRISDSRKRLARLGMVFAALAAAGALALVLLGPQIKTSQKVVPPIGWGLFVFGGGIVAMLGGALATTRIEREPLRLKTPPKQPPEPAFDVREILRDQHEGLRPSGPIPTGNLPGPAGPLGAPLFDAAPQLRPLYDVQGAPPTPAAPQLPNRAPTPMPRASAHALAGLDTPPPELLSPAFGHAAHEGSSPPGPSGQPPRYDESAAQQQTFGQPPAPFGQPPAAQQRPKPATGAPPPFAARRAGALSSPPFAAQRSGSPSSPPPFAAERPGSPSSRPPFGAERPGSPSSRPRASGPSTPPKFAAPSVAPPADPLAATVPAPSRVPPPRPKKISVPPPRTTPFARQPAPHSTPSIITSAPKLGATIDAPTEAATEPAPRTSKPTLAHAVPPMPVIDTPPPQLVRGATDSDDRLETGMRETEMITAVEIDHEAKALYEEQRRRAAGRAETATGIGGPPTADDTDAIETAGRDRVAIDAAADERRPPSDDQLEHASQPASPPRRDSQPASLTARDSQPASPTARDSQPRSPAQHRASQPLIPNIAPIAPTAPAVTAPVATVATTATTATPTPASPPTPAAPRLPISTAPASLPPPRTATLPVSGPTPACPQCESPMAWVEEHLRFYCRSCRMYF